jgi:hypothetical protein
MSVCSDTFYRGCVTYVNLRLSTQRSYKKKLSVQMGISGCEYEDLLIPNKKESMSQTFEIHFL